MMGITTHVLDLMHGTPAAGIHCVLSTLAKPFEAPIHVASRALNAQGRSDGSLLGDQSLSIGLYRLSFAVGDYYRKRGVTLDRSAFLDVVDVSFLIGDPDEHYHVPLLVSPYGYSTYRGS